MPGVEPLTLQVMSLELYYKTNLASKTERC